MAGRLPLPEPDQDSVSYYVAFTPEQVKIIENNNGAHIIRALRRAGGSGKTVQKPGLMISGNKDSQKAP